jgi:hypothetical protein
LRHRFAVLATALTVVLAVAACGTTGEKKADKTTTTTVAKSTTTKPKTTTTTEATDDAQARAEEIDVSPAELPDGWSSTPHEEDEENLVSECSDYDVTDLAEGTYYTDDFVFGDLENNDGQQLSIGTRVFEDEDTATGIMDVVSTDDFIACVNDTVKTSLGGQIDGEIEARDVTTSADQTAGFSGHLLLTSGSTGETLDFWIAFVAIRSGDLITGMSAVALGQDLDGQVITDLADRIVELQGA